MEHDKNIKNPDSPLDKDRMKKALRTVFLRNTQLLKNEEFRDFIELVADRCMFLRPSRAGSYNEYDRGRIDALRDIISSFVLIGEGGPEWLAEYAESRGKEVENGPQH